MSGLYVPSNDEAEARARRCRALLYDEPEEPADVWTADDADAALTAELRARVRSDKDSVVLVWGEPGSGKSTWVLDRARKVDETFTPETLPTRVAFKNSDVATLYETTPRYGAAWIDEAGSVGLLSSEPPNSKRQRRLIELINIIRAKNLLLFVVIPSPDDLCKGFRVRRADGRVECAPREEGVPTKAFWGRRVSRRHYFLTDSRWLGFSDDAHGVPLTWPDYRTNPDPALRAFWDAYAPLKAAFLDRRIQELGEAARRDEEDDGETE